MAVKDVAQELVLAVGPVRRPEEAAGHSHMDKKSIIPTGAARSAV